MNRRRPSFVLTALAALGSFLVPAKAVAPETGASAYQSMLAIGKKKAGTRKRKPIDSTSHRRYGRMLRYPKQKWAIFRTSPVGGLAKNGTVIQWNPFRRVRSFGDAPHSTPFRPHCGKHGLRFKHLRWRAVFEDESSGLRRSLKARAFTCPACVRAA